MKILKSKVSIYKAQFKEFLLDLRDDGYPAISIEEAKKRVGKAVEDYRKNGMKSCKVLNDKFWDDTEKRLLERRRQVSYHRIKN